MAGLLFAGLEVIGHFRVKRARKFAQKFEFTKENRMNSFVSNWQIRTINFSATVGAFRWQAFEIKREVQLSDLVCLIRLSGSPMKAALRPHALSTG